MLDTDAQVSLPRLVAQVELMHTRHQTRLRFKMTYIALSFVLGGCCFSLRHSTCQAQHGVRVPAGCMIASQQLALRTNTDWILPQLQVLSSSKCPNCVQLPMEDDAQLSQQQLEQLTGRPLSPEAAAASAADSQQGLNFPITTSGPDTAGAEERQYCTARPLTAAAICTLRIVLATGQQQPER